MTGAPIVGTSMWGFRELDIDEVLAYCRAEGIGSVEAQVHPQAPRHFRVDLTETEVAGMLDRAAAAGVTFEALALANDFTVPPERLAGEVARVGAGLRLARRLGVHRVRIFAGWRRADDVDAAGFARLAEALREAAEQAAEAGLQLALENHGGITATAADMRRLLDAVAHPALGVLFDPVNFVRSGQDPLAALAMLGTEVVYTHAKDLTPDGEVCAVGRGTLPWAAMGAILMERAAPLIVIEQTDPRDAAETTRLSAAALRVRTTTPNEGRV